MQVPHDGSDGFAATNSRPSIHLGLIGHATTRLGQSVPPSQIGTLYLLGFFDSCRPLGPNGSDRRR
jgi:hypothetical protein